MTRLLAALAAVLAMAASGCTTAEATEVNATFADVADLTTNSAVKIADVAVGTVVDIRLDEDLQAAVRMEIRPDVELPARLQANLRKTSVLGERYVELVPLAGGAGTWVSGGTVEQTTVVPELEEVVASSTDLLVAISTDNLAGAIRAGAEGLDGRGQTFGQILDDLEQVTATYSDNSEDLVRLLDGLDAFLADVGPAAELHGRALARSEEFLRVLAEEDDRLIDTLLELQDLAETGTDIITTHRQRIDDFVVRAEAITDEIVAPQRLPALDQFFVHLAGHNFNTIRGVNREHAQVVLDFIVCGVNDEPGDPLRACTDPPQGRERPEPRPPQEY